jgi:glutamate racemase
MIGIFDSGSGGLTVLRALKERAPDCDVVYFADLANMPYGNKTQSQLKQLTRSAISFLTKQGATHIISACNSVSMQVLTTLSKELHDGGIEIIEMVTPTVTALSNQKDKKILLLATQATVNSNIYRDAFIKKGIEIQQSAIAPLAEAIEKNLGEEEIQEILNVNLEKISLYNPDIVILGCTQYPLIKNSFNSFFFKKGINPTVFDPADEAVKEAEKKFNIT